MASSDATGQTVAPDTDAPETANGQATGLNLAALAESKESTPTVPDEVKTFVDHGHKSWQEKPKVWREVALGTEDAVNEVVKMARAFAKATSRTFRVNVAQTGGGKLVYKVTDPITKGTAADSDEDAGSNG